MKNAYEIFIGNPEVKRTLEQPSHRRDNIEMDIKRTTVRMCGLVSYGSR